MPIWGGRRAIFQICGVIVQYSFFESQAGIPQMKAKTYEVCNWLSLPKEGCWCQMMFYRVKACGSPECQWQMMSLLSGAV